MTAAAVLPVRLLMDPRLKRLNLKSLALSLTDLVMPRVCLCCGRGLLPCERHLCSVCMADLPLTHFEGARVNPMADKLNSLVNAESYLQASALFYYTGEYKKITQALKYGRNFGAGHFIAGMLGRRLASSSFWAGADVVCPVPLHWTRRLKRGYNQAEVIAQDIARELGAEYVPGLLRRIRRTGTQTRLASDARAQNVAAAFEARPVWPRATTNSRSLWERGDFSDGAAKIRILLVDDVCTTGATLAACCRALMDEFGNSVEIAVATLAYVD